MGTTNEAVFEKKEVIDISDFFTKSNEEEGRWTEVSVFGKNLGIEFKILGSNSDRVTILNEQFNKKLSECKKIADESERAKKIANLYAISAADRVVGIRTKDNKEVLMGGKPLEMSDETVRQILTNSYDIASFVVRFSMDSENFTNKKID